MASAATLIHGFAGSAAEWGETVLEGLRVAGHSPMAVDLPGHGHRRSETAQDAFTLDATLALIDAAHEEPGPVVGYSMGGRLALHYAWRFPERVSRLVLESSSPGLAGEEERAGRRAADAALADRILDGGLESFVREWEALPLFASQDRLSQDVRAGVRAGRLANDASSLAVALRLLGTGALPSLWEELSGIHVPTLLVAGAEDRKFCEIAQRMSERMPDARLEIVQGAGHNVHLERPDDWCVTVVSFLRG